MNIPLKMLPGSIFHQLLDWGVSLGYLGAISSCRGNFPVKKGVRKIEMKTRFPKRLAKDETEVTFYKLRRGTERGIKKARVLLKTPGLSEEMRRRANQALLDYTRVDLLYDAQSEIILNETNPKIKATLALNLLERSAKIIDPFRDPYVDYEELWANEAIPLEGYYKDRWN